MTKTWAALGASALALVLVASTFDTAEAGRRGSGIRGGGGGHLAGRSFSGGALRSPRFVGRSHFAGRRHFGRRHIGPGLAIGVPLAYGTYAYSYGSGCRWLRIRALETGSGYWWSRYDDCINGYD